MVWLLMRWPSLFALFAAFQTGVASAKEFRLPVEKPVASLTVADDWRPEETPRGLRAQTKDGAVNLTVAATTDAKEMGTIIDEADARLKARKVVLERGTRQDHQLKIHNFPVEELVYQGRDDAGPVVVTFTFVTVGNAALVFTSWATRGGDQDHRTELGAMLDSIKLIGPATPTKIQP